MSGKAIAEDWLKAFCKEEGIECLLLFDSRAKGRTREGSDSDYILRRFGPLSQAFFGEAPPVMPDVVEIVRRKLSSINENLELTQPVD